MQRLLLTIAILAIGSHLSLSQVYTDLILGKAIPYQGSAGLTRAMRKTWTQLQLMGIKHIITTAKVTAPGEGKPTITTDTIIVNEELQKLFSRPQEDSLTSSTIAGEHIVTTPSEGDCGHTPCLDTLRFDAEGRLKSVTGFGYHGSRSFNIEYTPEDLVRMYDDNQPGGESALFFYDKTLSISRIDLGLHPTDVSDTQQQVDITRNKDGMLIKSITLGNLVATKKKDGTFDYKYVTKLVTRSVVTFKYE